MPLDEPFLSHQMPPQGAPALSEAPRLARAVAGPPPSPTPADDFGDLTKYLLAIRRRWPLILVCTLLAVGFALVRYSLTTKEYQAETTIQIERKRLSLAALGQGGWLEDWWNMEYYPTQYLLLRSRGMAERVVRNLRLYEDPTFTGRPAGLAPGGDDELAASDDQREIANLAGRLLGGLSVNPIKDTQLVELTYRSSSPELAARIANGYAQAFIEWGVETRTETVRGASTFLTDQIESLRDEIDVLQRELNTFARDSDLALDPAGEALLERQTTLAEKANQLAVERISREATYRTLVAQSDETIASTRAGAEVARQRNELRELEAEYERNLETYTPEWPEMQALRQRIEVAREQLQRRIRDEAREARDEAFAAYDSVRREEQALEGEMRELAEELRGVDSAALDYQTKRTTLEARKKTLDELLARQSETDVASRVQTSQDSNVRIVDSAVVPAQAYKPNLESSLTQALALGFMAGIGLILLIELLDRTVKKPEELESLLGLPVLAVVPDINQQRPSGLRGRYGYGYSGYGYGYGYGEDAPATPTARLLGRLRPAAARTGGEEDERDIELLPHTQPRLAVCEAYRSLRTALLLSTARELKVVALTSAEPGEGKTATSTNLAVVLSQLGRKVLIIDGDLRRPRMHKVFKISNRFGLVSCLTQNLDLDQVIVESEVPNLYVCPAGPIPPNPSELLASERMEEILASARQRFAYVVIDTPPALPVADAVILGTMADGVIVCGRAGVLVREDARACRERLRYAELRLLGTVLNRYRTSPNRYNKRYRYYGSYGDSPAEVAADSAA